MQTERVILWGGTGQAKVMRPVLERAGAKVIAVCDDTTDLPPPFLFSGVAVGADGTVYASSDRRNAVYRIRRP